jgi:DNA-binding CsgD family transcriptional regulator
MPRSGAWSGTAPPAPSAPWDWDCSWNAPAAAPLLSGAIHLCRILGNAVERGHVLESLHRLRGGEVVVVDADGEEVLRTEGLQRLLKSHFPPAELGSGLLPGILAERLAWLTAARPPRTSWVGFLSTLKVTFARLPLEGHWALLLEDTLPAEWRKVLTPREAEVVACVLHGWDNQLIADHLGCALETARTHLYRAFRKLRVPTRAKLMALAMEGQAEFLEPPP